MAIFHLEGKIIGRSGGRSAVAAAAYRAAARLLDERIGVTYNYLFKKEDVYYTTIILPQGASKVLSEREVLWNTVEQAEKRKDAQLAREFNVSLPLELTMEQNLKLAKDFVNKAFVAKGMIADLSIHLGHKNGEFQPHFHVMLTLREVNHEGFGKKVRDWNNKALLQGWRTEWAEICNSYLAYHGHEARIDHRTLEEQGLDLAPQTKVGAAAVRLKLDKFIEHQQLARCNGVKLLKNPQMILEILTSYSDSFSYEDLARFANRHSADAKQFNEICAVVINHPECIKIDEGMDNLGVFTTKLMKNVEQNIALKTEAIKKKAKFKTHSWLIEDGINHSSSSNEQQQAIRHLTDSDNIACIKGLAGTGKSYLLHTVRKIWQKAGFSPVGIALSGMAAENLTKSLEMPSFTLASRLKKWNEGKQLPGIKDIIIVDEAGMIGSKQMLQLLDVVNKAGAKLVLVGDDKQLRAIEVGEPFSHIAELTGFVCLEDIKRQKHAWQRQATLDFAFSKASDALASYRERGCLHRHSTERIAMQAMIDAWDRNRLKNDKQSYLLLACRQQQVDMLNNMAHKVRLANGELGKEKLFITNKGARDFAEGELIYFTRNDAKLGVRNGTAGKIIKIKGDILTISGCFGDNKVKNISFSFKKYNHLEYGYAVTINKAQGLTVDNSYLLASRAIDKRTAYVAMSRHRLSSNLYYTASEFPTIVHLERTFSLSRNRIGISEPLLKNTEIYKGLRLEPRGRILEI